MKLVIVESPTKAKTIGKFLGNTYVIRASMGHVMDLPKSKLGIDISNNFAPQYEVNADKKSTISELKKLAKESDGIILATDPDREGEAISAHIRDLLSESSKSQVSSSKNHKPSAISNKPFSRIVFHEITKDAIEDAIGHPGVVNENLVNAQTARRVLDRLVGYKLSPILWQKVRRGLSAGRVQSVALRLIVEREKEIEKFIKEPYWTVTAALAKSIEHRVKGKGENADVARGETSARGDLMTEFELIEINHSKIELSKSFDLYDGKYTISKTVIDSQEKADTILSELKQKEFIVADVAKRETKRSPQPPFTTSTLQQQASQRFGYSGKRTMSLAQKLYEEGYITYHRTDSLNLATSAVSNMRSYVKKTFGEKYVPEKPRFFKGTQKNAQEAHEAIRPTRAEKTPESVSADLGAMYGKVYELIWRRALASQMSDALVESTTVLVDALDSSEFRVQSSDGERFSTNYELPTTNSAHRFKTNGSVLLFEGFLKMNPFGLTDKRLPSFTADEKLDLSDVLADGHETPPPPRYNDASLINSLEEGGIGRPSTYATIISVLEDRGYVERREGRFYPTAVGNTVNDFLVTHFSDIDDIPFTAQMEDKLDAIANGESEWVPVIRDFYTPFEKELEKVQDAPRVQIAVEETDEICPKDGAPLVIRTGRFGKFISCKNFPECDFKKALIQATDFICPKDGGKVIARRTRKGRTFYGCSNYPACDFAVWKLSDMKKDESGNTIVKESVLEAQEQAKQKKLEQTTSETPEKVIKEKIVKKKKFPAKKTAKKVVKKK